MKIVDSYGINDGSTFFSVELAEDRFVDVKVCEDGLVYVMENEDGSTVYSDRAYFDKGVDAYYPGFEYDEKAVVNLVRDAAFLKDNTLDAPEVPAVLVEEVSRGEFRRYALTPKEFDEKFGQPQVVGFSSDGWEAFSVESADFWCRRGVARDDVWKKFFSDMTYGLSKNDVADGFRACVREDLMGDLKEYLPDNKQVLKGLNDMNERFEELKRALFMDGIEEIEDFLGYEIDPEEDKDVIERRMDIVYEQMPEEDLEKFFAKHHLLDKEAALRFVIPVMQRERITLAHISEELNYRERAGVKDGREGWDDGLVDYSTKELEVIESAWSEMESGKNKVRVAIESTDDYSNSEFHSRLVDVDVQQADGCYGRVVDYYRIVAINENGRIEKHDDRVFEDADEARAAALENKGLELVGYDELVHEAGKGLGVVLADAKARSDASSYDQIDKTVELGYKCF